MNNTVGGTPATLYILRGLDTNGQEFFYTGRAGDKWVSKLRGESFGYASHTQANNKAMMFNKLGMPVRFVVMPY